jgi:hypothetical protein
MGEKGYKVIVIGLLFVIIAVLLSAYFLLEQQKLKSEIDTLQLTKNEGLTNYVQCVQALRDLRLQAGVNCYTCDPNGCAKLNVTVGGGAQ